MDAAVRDMANRQFGLGANPNDPNGWQQATCCPMTSMPVIEYVTMTVPLPLQDTWLCETFGAKIEILNQQGTPPGVASIDSSFAINGLLQTNMFVVGIGIHLFGEPQAFTQIGNAVQKCLTAIPVSSDVWSLNDLAHGALGPTTTAGTIIPAALEWGTADWNAIWHMANAYQFQWTFCNRYLLLNELLADVAFFGPYASGEGFGNSDTFVQQYVKKVNAYYRHHTDYVFTPVQHRRRGSVNGSTVTGATSTPANLGVFSPTSDFVLANVSYGGLGVTQGTSNGNPYRKVSKPIFLPMGAPIACRLSVQDAYHFREMTRYMSVSEGADTNQVALVQVDTVLNGLQTFTGPAGLELTMDQGGNTFASQPVNTDRMLFKGGVMKMAMLLKGYEVGGSWLPAFQNPTPQICSQVYIPGASQAGSVGLLGGSGGR